MNLSSITVLISCFLLVTCRIHIYCPRVTSTPEARLKMKTACSVFDKLLDLYVSVKKQLRDRLLYSCHPGPLLQVCIPTRAKEFPKAINCQIRPQGYGGGQGEPVPDSIGDSPISPDTPTRPILGTEEVIEVARGE